jgi:hypothetical protein
MTITTTSAPGAVQLSSSAGASTSSTNAFQTASKETEPDRVPAICKAQAGGHRVTRRTLMNIAINAGALVAAPSVAVATPVASQEASSAVVDYSAMLTRAEYCVECLRTRYVGDGWKIDEEAAKRTLQYFRSQAEGQPENDEEWQAAVAFIGSHGQSLDWILRGEPGVMICRAAASSDRARSSKFVVQPKTSSPALKAVERYRTAEKQFGRAWEKFDDARGEAEERFGRQPIALIHWRNYYIGGPEIENRREDLLRLGEEDPAIIEQEYQDAKKRYRRALKAEKDWEKQVGIEHLSKAVDLARAQLMAAENLLGSVDLKSTWDAAAIIDAVCESSRYSEGSLEKWEWNALRRATKFLKRANSTEVVAA